IRTTSVVGNEGVRAVGCDLGVESLLAQQEGERVGHRLLVLDDQDLGHVAPRWAGSGSGRDADSDETSCPASGFDSNVGKRRVKVEPVPSRLHTVALPPWLAATCLTIA